MALSVVVALVASNVGVPALVAFLAFGMLLGVDGPGHIGFEDVELAQFVGTIGLAAILFEGGLSTSLRRLRGSHTGGAAKYSWRSGNGGTHEYRGAFII